MDCFISRIDAGAAVEAVGGAAAVALASSEEIGGAKDFSKV